MTMTAGGLWPLTYHECRARFLRAADTVDAVVRSAALEVRGPSGEELAIDLARIGPDRADRVLVLMSGTHGIEGFAGSAIQLDVLHQVAEGAVILPPGVAVVLVHAANPWGMAWWRRANENNVDLNRNWIDFDDDHSPPVNDGYREVHELLCPDRLDDGSAFVAELGRLAEANGVDWLVRAISGGQYTHADGLYYGGATRQPSARILAELLPAAVGVAAKVFGVDLHTGYGPSGTYSLLSRMPVGSSEDRWFRSRFDEDRIVSTAPTRPEETVVRSGPLLPGLLAELRADRSHSVTFELGTRSDVRMIVAERAEHVVHRSGDRTSPEHAAAIWEHRICSIPDEEDWQRTGLAYGRTVVGAALQALPAL